MGAARNVIDAASRSTSAGLPIALQVGAMRITFVGLIGVVNGILHAIRVSPWGILDPRQPAEHPRAALCSGRLAARRSMG